MKIPRYWARARAGKDDAVPGMVVYGWSDTSLEEARERARERVTQVCANVAKVVNGGARQSGDYPYPRSPLREEIIQEFANGDVTNMVTRNSYGALILNTDRVVIVDADIPQDGFVQSIKRLFGKAENEDAVLAHLRAAAGTLRCALRVYRTRAGFRAIVTDRLCAPDQPFAKQLFEGTGADPQYVRLCHLQNSYRARLTPKPWRIDLPKPPPYPREEAAERAAFDAWLHDYGEAMQQVSTCRFVESIGGDTVLPAVDAVLKIHDPLTGALDAARALA